MYQMLSKGIYSSVEVKKASCPMTVIQSCNTVWRKPIAKDHWRNEGREIFQRPCKRAVKRDL